jgi:hypothetical protein
MKRTILAGNYAFKAKPGWSPNLAGLAIYSKGKLVRESAVDTYHFLISSERAL